MLRVNVQEAQSAPRVNGTLEKSRMRFLARCSCEKISNVRLICGHKELIDALSKNF